MIRWIRQYLAITRNAFVVCLSDPVYLVLLLSTLVLMAFFASLPSYNFGDELRLVRDQSLALIFAGGCVVGVIGVATVIIRDLRQGTISVLMSRPVSGMSFVFGKWTGIAGGLLLYHVTLTVAALWATRIISGGHDQELDGVALGIYAGAILLALGAVALKHWFSGGWYVWQASLAVCAGFFIGFLIVNFIGEHGLQPFGRNVDWAMLQGCLLLLMAELIFAGLLMPFAVRLDMVTVMAIGIACFFLGLLSPFALQLIFGGGTLNAIFSGLVPNWQAFWIADLLAEREGELVLTAGFVLSALVHTLVYAGACLLVATLLFNRREFSSDDTL